MSLDLTSAIEDITQQLIEKYKPEKIILFGSAAADPLSAEDLDFLIIKSDVPVLGIDRVRELDRLIERSVPVDMIVLKPQELDHRLSMADPFIAGIVRSGRFLHG